MKFQPQKLLGRNKRDTNAVRVQSYKINVMVRTAKVIWSCEKNKQNFSICYHIMSPHYYHGETSELLKGWFTQKGKFCYHLNRSVGFYRKSINHQNCETLDKTSLFVLRIPFTITSKGSKFNRVKNDKHFIKKSACPQQNVIKLKVPFHENCFF